MILSKFETSRLILKPVSLKDVYSYEKHFIDYEVIRHLSSTIPWPYPENGVEKHMKEMIFPRQGKTNFHWGIFLKSDIENVIGSIELFKTGHPEHRGFWLGKEFWGNGIMTEATYPINDFAFNTFKYDKLTFANAVGNFRSRRIKEKTGCELIKIIPTKFVDPNLTESEIWELTKEDWESHKSKNQVHYKTYK